MHPCLRQQAKRHTSRIRSTQNLCTQCSFTAHNALRIHGSRWNSSSSSSGSEQGIEPASLLGNRTVSAHVREEPVKLGEHMSHRRSLEYLKSAGIAPPDGVTPLSVPKNPLPAKPARPPYPCPHLTDLEARFYLYPLYERGWGVHTKIPVRTNPEEPPSAPSLMLAKDLHFIWHAPLLDFLADLNVLVKKENHHPRVSYEFRNMGLRMQTHVAALHDLPEQPSITSDSEPSSSPPPPHRMPGITLRDIRLAYLIEEILEPHYEFNKLTHPKTSPLAQPKSLRKLSFTMQREHQEQIEAEEGIKSSLSKPKGQCVVCGENHWSTTCPNRFNVKPKVPCDLCGGDHWRFTCHLYKDWKAQVKKAEKNDL